MPLAGKRLLAADDNDLSMEVLEKLLTNTGILVERAHDGREACEMFGKSPEGYYAAILMDLDMPGVDGCEAASLIRMADHKGCQDHSYLGSYRKHPFRRRGRGPFKRHERSDPETP